MRRAWSIVVLSALMAAIVAPPLAAFELSNDAHACCRRGGAHHCKDLILTGSGFGVKDPNCPFQHFAASAPGPSAFVLTRPVALRTAHSGSFASQPSNADHAIQAYIASVLDRGPPLS